MLCLWDSETVNVELKAVQGKKKTNLGEDRFQY